MLFSDMNWTKKAQTEEDNVISDFVEESDFLSQDLDFVKMETLPALPEHMPPMEKQKV